MTKRQKIVYIYFIILPIIDVITSLITRFNISKLSLGMVVKGLTLVFAVGYTLFYSKYKYRKQSIWYMIILLIFSICYVLSKMEIFSIHFLINEISVAIHYFYFPLMIIGVFNYFNDIKMPSKIIEKILMITSGWYTLLLLIPYITGTSFNSYDWTNYFGNNGWFYSANEIGAITVLLLSSWLYFLNDCKNKYRVLVFIPILLSIALVGTKVSYMGMIIVTLLLCLLYFLNDKSDSEGNRYYVPMFIIAILVVVCSLSPTISNIGNNINNLDLPDEDNGLIKFSDISKDNFIFNTVKVLLNGREDFFIQNYFTYKDHGVKNMMFGTGWTDWPRIGYTYERKLIEIDYLDIIIHYGIVGFIVYFIPVIFLLRCFLKSKTKKTSYFWYNLFIFGLGILISSIAGHVLAAPAVSIYLTLFLYIIYNSLEENSINEKNSHIC